ncbi:BlaR1 peptidase M56 [Rubripirellula lacrimiformis]|uniref:BlaR1 peptidase M56 n=1 Tax=Rubripirellula lacrimiformis TaxID=1930273 RepID=A0A517NKG1_9BACT|nr:M56 family metallopeptidase [Rubripirellula lacrimiformis]QDT07628.1 BlaR1 peptidase M56 [Rubripirellula lacrimiformis]
MSPWVAWIEPIAIWDWLVSGSMTQWLVSNTVVAILIACVAIIADRFVRRPALTHLLWVMVLVKLLTPPIASLPITIDSGAIESMVRTTGAKLTIVDSVDAAHLNDMAAGMGAAADAPTLLTTPALLTAAWIVGSLMMLVWILRASWRVHQLIERRGRFDITATRQLASLVPANGFHSPRRKSPPPVWLVDAVVSPMLVSPMFRRFGGEVRIVFPKALWARLDEPARGSLLLHELEHWRRQDWIVRFIEVTTMTALWWHPLVWIAKLQIEYCEECCCDLAASGGKQGSPRIYAEAILQTLDFLCEPVERHHCEVEPRPIASGVGHLPKLQYRLRQIIKPTIHRNVGRSGFAMITAVLILLPIYPVIVLNRTSKASEETRVAKPNQPEVLTAGSEVDPDWSRRRIEIPAASNN